LHARLITEVTIIKANVIIKADKKLKAVCMPMEHVIFPSKFIKIAEQTIKPVSGSKNAITASAATQGPSLPPSFQ
jgi:hypothetical protein